MQYAQLTPDKLSLAHGVTDDRLCFYRFLGTLFNQPLDKENIAQLFHPDYITAFQAAFPDAQGSPAFADWIAFIRQHLHEDSEALYQMLALEFTRLFRGLYAHSGPRPPYEAVYRSEHQELSLTILRQVSQFYRKLGLASDGKERVDFIGLELDLMRCLIEEELQAREAGEHEKLQKHLALEQEWLQEHMILWIPTFCEELQGHARLDFYKSLAAIAAQYLRDDLAYLEQASSATA